MYEINADRLVQSSYCLKTEGVKEEQKKTCGIPDEKDKFTPDKQSSFFKMKTFSSN